METDEFHLEQDVDPTGVLVIAAGGYLDEAGGIQLSREAGAALEAGHRHLRIDLEGVVLFNCSGVRWLLFTLEDLERRHGDVDLVHLHPPLKRILDITA